MTRHHYRRPIAVAALLFLVLLALPNAAFSTPPDKRAHVEEK